MPAISPRLVSGNAFLALVPETGLQIVLSSTTAHYDGDIERGYMNGAGTAISPVDTSGNGPAGGERVELLQ